MILPFGWPAWVYKVIGAGALLAACLLMVKCYGDSKIAEGRLKERVAHHDEAEVQLLAGQKIIIENQVELKAANQKNMAASVAAEARIVREIDSLEKQLVAKMAELAKVRTARDEEIDKLPPAALPSEILNQSRRLAAQPEPPN